MAPGARGRSATNAGPLGLTAWVALVQRAGATADPADVRAAHSDLIVRWSQPHRHYHNLSHLNAVLGHIDELGGSDAARLAAWFHDAVYNPARDDNEAASARLAEAMLTELGVPRPLVDRVVRLVLMTAEHKPDLDDADGRILADADLAILAAAPADYDAYARAVRREYAHVRGSDFRRGRSAILRGLLDRDQLFLTAHGQAHWEQPARANLARELALLDSRTA